MDFPIYIKAGRTAMKIRSVSEWVWQYWCQNWCWWIEVDSEMKVLSKWFEDLKIVEITEEEWIQDEWLFQKEKIVLIKWQQEAIKAMANNERIFIPTHRAAWKTFFRNYVKQNFPDLYQKYFEQNNFVLDPKL